VTLWQIGGKEIHSFDDEGTYNYDPVGDMFDDTNTYGADDYSWMDDFNFGDELFNTDTSPEGQISAWMDNYFNSGASTEGVGVDDFLEGGDYYSEPEGESGILKFFAELFGNPGKNPPRSGNKLGAVGQYLGDFLSSPLAALLLMNQKNKDAREQMNIPIGQEAYGSGAGVGSFPDYQISNIQPALLPGMAYANQPTTFNNTPPGMQAGGLAHHHPQLHSHTQAPQGPQPLPYIPGRPGSRAFPSPYLPDGMQSGGLASLENRMEGPGDITQAMLEPGEFVMTRKATENLTPEYLYDLMHQAENAGRMT
jgi:hypothetical protein